MEELYNKIKEAAAFIRSKSDPLCKLALVTGSGLDTLISDFTVETRISFAQIPHFVKSTFHKGELLICSYNDTKLLVLNGRLHYYEGYSAQEVTFPVRVLKELGIKKLILTNASGGLNPKYEPGEIVIIKDHINLMPEHPLRGSNDLRLGERFPDMSDAYCREWRKVINRLADKLGYDLTEGVYAGFQGPSLETPSEYRFLHVIGADMVGMSTVPEVIVANHCDMQVAAFSIVTNLCYPPEKVKVTTVDDVIQTASASVPKLSKLINMLIINS